MSLSISRAKRGEGLVEDVGRDAGERAAEDVALDQADDLDQLGVADRALVVVVEDLEQERVSDVDLELVEVGDRLAQRGVVGSVEGQLDPVLRVLVDVGDELGVRELARLRQRLEALVDAVDLRDLARLHRQVVAHEAVEQVLVLGRERLLERVPGVGVDLGLLPWRLAHEDVVADEVGLREVEAGRVQALEDQLRVVVIPLECDVDHQQLLEASEHLLKRQRRPPQLLDEEVVGIDQPRRLGDVDLATVDEAHEGVAVALGQEELVACLRRRVDILLLEQVVLDQLPRRRRAEPSPSASTARASASSRSEIVVSRC